MDHDDLRIQWIKSKVESGLFLEFQEAKARPVLKQGPEALAPNPSLVADPFMDCLQRDGQLEALLTFLNGYKEGSALVFWADVHCIQTRVEAESLVDTQGALAESTGDESNGLEPVEPMPVI